MTITQHIRQHIYDVLGVHQPQQIHSMDVLTKTEWSSEFERLMRNRLIMGAFRYGLMRKNRNNKYDRVSSIKKRIYAYELTGNTEHLVDIANLCLLEFDSPSHKKAHFVGIDTHGRIGVDKRNNHGG